MSHRLLVIDHDVACVETIMEHAAERGHVCGGVTDPNCVLTVARELRPDVIVCALGFDRFRGDVLSNFKRDPMLWRVPVVLLVNVGIHRVRRESVTHGIHVLLCKPVDTNELFSRIEEIMGQKDPHDASTRPKKA